MPARRSRPRRHRARARRPRSPHRATRSASASASAWRRSRVGRRRGAHALDLGVGLRPHARGLGLATRRRDPRLRDLGLDQHLLLAPHDLGLHVRGRGLALEHLAAHLRLALRVVRALQLVRDLLVGLRLHELRRRRDVADQGVDAIDIVRRDRGADVQVRLALAGACARVRNSSTVDSWAELRK